MSDVTIREVMDDVLGASFDPSMVYRSGVRTLGKILDGSLTTISPANPVVYAIENQAALIAAFLEESKTQHRRLMQAAALTMEDLYPHMADIHFTNIFNLPSSTTFTIAFNKAEIMAAMVAVPGTLDKKVTIPKNSYFTIGDYEFGIHYPIDIILQVHNGIRVSYDTTNMTPLQKLASNELKKRIIKRDDIEYLSIDVPVFQFNIISKSPTILSSKTFSYNIDITDLYYACRIYRTLSDGSQEEMKVTYSEEIYDPLSPTAVVKVLEGSVNVTVPQIYITNGMVGELRIDVYTTKGPLETRFDSYPVGSIGRRFRDLNKNASTTYSAPLNKLGTCMILSEEPVTGGTLAMTFDELRAAVIADAIGDPNLPITPAQIQNYLNRKGYDIITNTDLVTDRVFLATRNMPTPSNTTLLTAANASIEMMTSSFMDLIGSSAVIDNNTAVTITPDAIYKLDSGILRLLSDSETTLLKNLRSDLLAANVSANDYMYSPFHYVLDKANNQFRLSPYYLDNPSAEALSYVNDNAGTLISVSTNAYKLTKSGNNYVLRITTTSDQAYKELIDSDTQVLLGFRSPTEQNIAWILGNQIGLTADKERIYEFVLETRLAINDSDRIDFRNFKMYDTGDKTIYADLSQDFSIIYTTKSQVGSLFQSGSIDAKIPRYLVDSTAKGIKEEQITLNFGLALNNLWARARTVASSVEYERYPTDVILRYQNDVYQKDSTGSELIWVDGELTRVLLHSKGDPILDSDNNEQIQHPANSLVYDENGLPISKGVRYLRQRFEIFLIEGVYAFTNDDVAIAYRTQVAQAVANWVTQDLAEIGKATMDKSKTYFYPKTIAGTTNVVVSDGLVQQINSAQSFDVVMYLPSTSADDDVLKAQLRKQTITVISQYLTDNQQLAISDIVRLLRNAYGNDVIDVQVSYFGSDKSIPAMQLVNEVHRCGIRKRLVSRDDNRLVVEEAITTTFQTLS